MGAFASTIRVLVIAFAGSNRDETRHAPCDFDSRSTLNTLARSRAPLELGAPRLLRLNQRDLASPGAGGVREKERRGRTLTWTNADMKVMRTHDTSVPRAIALCLIAVGATLGVAPASPPLLAQAAGPQRSIDVIEVRSGFYMLTGAGGNIAAQIGPAGVILVDAGAAGTSADVLKALAQLTHRAVRYIINTSDDADHTGGNDVLSKAGTSILPTASGNGNGSINAEVLANGGAASVLAFENVLQRMSAANPPIPDDLWPSKVYSGASYPMYLNGEGIQVIHLPDAHSDADSAVFFRRNDVIVTGDVFDTTRFPVIDLARGGTIQGEIDALNRLIDLAIPPFPLPWLEDRTFIIPGHGRLCDRPDLVEYRDMVTIVRDVVDDMKKRGMRLDQVKAADPTKPYRRRYGADSGPWTTDMFVEAIYKSLPAHDQRSER